MISRYLTPMLVIAVSMGVYFLYIDKTYKGISQQLARELVIEGFIVDAKDAKNLLDKVIAEHRSFPQDADRRLNILLPDTVDYAQLVIDVEAIAMRHGLSVRSPIVLLGIPNPDVPKNFLEHGINFKVVSTYPTFRKFLYDMEASLAIRDVNGISFTSSASLDDVGSGISPEFEVLIYDVNLKAYSLR